MDIVAQRTARRRIIATMPAFSTPTTIELPAEVLARREQLAIKPEPITLAGAIVELRPLDLDADCEALHAVSSGAPFQLGGRAHGAYDPDDRIWRWMSGGPFADAAALRRWLADQIAAPDGLPLTVRVAGTPVGVANFLASQPQHLKIELGAIWYGPIAQGTGVSAEVAYLLLDHAFALGYRRVEWKCDAKNQRSRRAALAYGFAFEGVQDAHYIVKRKNRDTAWYRMLDSEWSTFGVRLRGHAASRGWPVG
jgi:RimJ/RimL family protein N-acetyltransferase